jgi:hypothetical protein
MYLPWQRRITNEIDPLNPIIMQYMIIERFHPGKVKEIYSRFDEKGRMLPAGLSFINSWINQSVTVCYQLMETESRQLIDEWISHWNDLAEFEVVAVVNSAEAKAIALSSGEI